MKESSKFDLVFPSQPAEELNFGREIFTPNELTDIITGTKGGIAKIIHISCFNYTSQTGLSASPILRVRAVDNALYNLVICTNSHSYGVLLKDKLQFPEDDLLS